MNNKTMQELLKELNKALYNFKQIFLQELCNTKIFKVVVKIILKLKGE